MISHSHVLDSFFFCLQTLGCDPVASLDHFTPERLGSASLVADEAVSGGGRITRITGVPGKTTVTVLCRASNGLVSKIGHSKRALRVVVLVLEKSRVL